MSLTYQAGKEGSPKVAFKKSGASTGPRVWTIAELLAHTNRVLKDSAKSEKNTRDALVKFMLVAPELESQGASWRSGFDEGHLQVFRVCD